MRRPFAFGVSAGVVLLLLPTLAMAQYDGPMYGGPGGYGPGGYGPGGYGPPGVGPGYGYPGRRRQARAHTSRDSVAYHGYRIGLTHRASSREGAREAAAVEHQVDIVNRAGLSASDLRLFRSKRIGSNGGMGAGRSHAGTDVSLGNISYGDDRPILLHEYMHVYQRTRLPGGFNNRAVLRFYEEAVANGLYPQGAYLLRNQKEFFAMTASAYLNGTVARPPYNRETIRETQPAYYAYLAQLFGPR